MNKTTNSGGRTYYCPFSGGGGDIYIPTDQDKRVGLYASRQLHKNSKLTSPKKEGELHSGAWENKALGETQNMFLQPQTNMFVCAMRQLVNCASQGLEEAKKVSF